MANNQLCKVYAKHWRLNMILFEFPLLGLEWLSAMARAHEAREAHPNQLSLSHRNDNQPNSFIQVIVV